MQLLQSVNLFFVRRGHSRITSLHCHHLVDLKKEEGRENVRKEYWLTDGLPGKTIETFESGSVGLILTESVPLRVAVHLVHHQVERLQRTKEVEEELG